MATFLFTGPHQEWLGHHPVIVGFNTAGDAVKEVANLQALLALKPTAIGIIEAQLFDDLPNLQLPEKETFLAFITPRRKPPLTTGEVHEEVTSFLMDPKTFCEFFKDKNDLPLSHLAYNASVDLHKSKFEVAHLLVKQTPVACGQAVPYESSKPAITIAHKGCISDLDLCLQYLRRGPDSIIAVCLDEPSNPAYEELISKHPAVTFFQVDPIGAGTFAIKEALIENSSADLIFIQDSDDLSTTDRIDRHLEAHQAHQASVIGSHELRFDEIEGKLLAVRYPTAVRVALNRWPGHSMLFGTVSFSKEVFKNIGGFSTQFKFGADTQFLFRSFFFADQHNIDEFLYIRKRHKKALTSPENMQATSKERARLGQMWADDFVAIRDNQKPLEGSSLSPKKLKSTQLVPLNEKAHQTLSKCKQ